MTTFKLRRGTASAWTAANPTLAAGEPGIETDTLKWKVGDGSTAWNSLAYFSSGGGAPAGSAGGALDGTYPNPGLAASVAGAGLAETSDVLSVNVDGSTIEIAADTLQLKDGGVTSAKIANGTIVDADVSSSAAVAYSKLNLASSIVAGDVSAAGLLALTGGAYSWTVVTKASDESVSGSTTLQDDNELFFTASSGVIYWVEIYGVYVSPVGAGTPDMKFAFGEDGTTRGVGGMWTFATNDAGAFAGASFRQVSAASIGTATTARAFAYIGPYVGNGGTAKLQWAQNTSDGNDLTVKAGSFIAYRRLY